MLTENFLNERKLSFLKKTKTFTDKKILISKSNCINSFSQNLLDVLKYLNNFFFFENLRSFNLEIERLNKFDTI